MIIYGDLIAGKIISELKTLKKPDKKIAVILIGGESASRSFIKRKKEMASRLGIDVEIFNLSKTSSEWDVVEKIGYLNKDKSVGGIVLQLPLPKGINKKRVVGHISKEKDIDGLNGGAIAPSVLTVFSILDYLGLNYRGKTIGVVGRGFLVGNPVASWFEEKGERIIVIEEGDDMKDLKKADIIISGVGKAGLVKDEFLKPGALVIDFGYNLENGKIKGDLDTNGLGKDITYTPTPGGTGPILVTSLMRNFYALNS